MVVHEGVTAASIIEHLARHRLVSYAEIRSYTTGLPTSIHLDPVPFESRERYCYATGRQAENFEIARRIPDRDSLFRSIVDAGALFDVVFVDPWHALEDTWEILSCAIRIASVGGVVVMHDCRPFGGVSLADEPESLETLWSGRTWFAWFLFLREVDPTVPICTIDADEGVGVVGVDSEPTRESLLRALDRASRSAAREDVPRLPADCDPASVRLVRVGEALPGWITGQPSDHRSSTDQPSLVG